MGVLSGVFRPIKRAVTRSEDVADVKHGAAQYYGKSVDNVTPGDVMAYRGTDHFANRFDDVVTNAGRAAGFPIGAGLGIAGLGGSYAYIQGREADVAVQEENTARYEKYQQQVAQAEEEYQAGNISYQEYQRRLENAREAYETAINPDDEDLTFYDLLAQMSTTQLLAVSGVTAIAIFYVVAPIARDADIDFSMEELLG